MGVLSIFPTIHHMHTQTPWGLSQTDKQYKLFGSTYFSGAVEMEKEY